MALRQEIDSIEEQDLYKAVLSLTTVEECHAFFKDLCTPAEITAMKERWKVVQLLDEGLSYRKIHEKTGSSLATIGRVARFLNQEYYNGYRLALSRIRKEESL